MGRQSLSRPLSDDASVSGVLVLNGFPGAYWNRGPPDAPLMLIVHGDLDPLVPADGIREVAEGLRDASESPVVYGELRGGHHAFDLYHSLRSDAVVDAAEASTARVRSRERPSRP